MCALKKVTWGRVSEPIPLLYLAPSAGLGGAETFLLSTARHHDPARFRPVYALLRDGELADSLRAFPGISVRVAPGPPARLSRPASWWSAVGWLARLAAEEKAALLHSTMPMARFSARRRPCGPVDRMSGFSMGRWGAGWTGLPELFPRAPCSSTPR